MHVLIPDEEFANCEPCEGHVRDVVLASHILAFDDNARDFAKSKPCDSSFESHEDYRCDLTGLNLLQNDDSITMDMFLDKSFAATFNDYF
jgi:hypothetical protein